MSEKLTVEDIRKIYPDANDETAQYLADSDTRVGRVLRKALANQETGDMLGVIPVTKALEALLPAWQQRRHTPTKRASHD